MTVCGDALTLLPDSPEGPNWPVTDIAERAHSVEMSVMKWLVFFVGDALVLAALGALLFLSLLYQPTWAWIVAPLVVLGALIGIAALTKSKPRTARTRTCRSANAHVTL